MLALLEPSGDDDAESGPQDATRRPDRAGVPILLHPSPSPGPTRDAASDLTSDPPSGPLRGASRGPGVAGLPGRLSDERLSRGLWVSVLIVGTVVAVSVAQQWIGGFLLLLALLGWGAWRLAAAIFRPATLPDRLLLAVTLGAAWIVVVAEVLSAGTWLGRPVGWLAGVGLLALIGAWTPVRARSWPRHPWAWVPAHPLGRLVLAVLAVYLGAVFFLTWFTGINISDSVVAYLPRSVRYLQNGTFAIYDTHYDYMPAFHQTLVAIQLLFLRSDVLVVPMSFLTAAVTSLGVFAFARSLRWPGHLPLGAALMPWAMPAFLLHASAPNFDILTGLWLLLALYFLRRGYAASNWRWLAAAALATGLALATKPTFWFAAPALGIIWLLTLLRPLRRQGLGRALKLGVVAAIIVGAIGLPYLVRNALVEGTLFGPAEFRTYLMGDLTPPERLRLLAFNSLAFGYQLVTPPSLMPREMAAASNDRFAWLAQSVGFSLPDMRLTPQENWSELIRHALPQHRYDSNHASFGAAFVLVVLPSMLVLPFMRRRLGPRWLFAVGLVIFGVSYILVYGLLYRYLVSSIRFLVEPAIVLAVIGPAWITLLPRRVHGPLLLALAVLLVAEMSDVIQHNRWMPPDRVMQTPRMDQIYVFAGAPPVGAHELDRKYPPPDLPEILIHDSGTGHPNFPDYTFLGPTLERRTRYWVPQPGVLPPGPFLTQDGTLAAQLIQAGMLPDRLSADTWLLLPNDRLRVRMTLVQDTAAAEPILRLEASAPAEKYPSARFGFFQIDGGNTIPVQEFGAKTTLDLPLSAARKGALRVEVRDGERGRTAERVTISKDVLLGL